MVNLKKKSKEESSEEEDSDNEEVLDMDLMDDGYMRRTDEMLANLVRLNKDADASAAPVANKEKKMSAQIAKFMIFLVKAVEDKKACQMCFEVLPKLLELLLDERRLGSADSILLVVDEIIRKKKKMSQEVVLPEESISKLDDIRCGVINLMSRIHFTSTLKHRFVEILSRVVKVTNQITKPSKKFTKELSSLAQSLSKPKDKNPTNPIVFEILAKKNSDVIVPLLDDIVKSINETKSRGIMRILYSLFFNQREDKEILKKISEAISEAFKSAISLTSIEKNPITGTVKDFIHFVKANRVTLSNNIDREGLASVIDKQVLSVNNIASTHKNLYDHCIILHHELEKKIVEKSNDPNKISEKPMKRKEITPPTTPAKKKQIEENPTPTPKKTASLNGSSTPKLLKKISSDVSTTPQKKTKTSK